MKPAFSILLVAALIVAGLLLFFREGADQEPLTASQTDESSQPVLGETASLGTGGASTAVARQQASTERSEADGILVKVVDAATDEPVPGANVYLMDKTSAFWARWQSKINAIPTWEQQDHLLAPRFGLAYTSNAEGRLRLPPASPSSLVYALTADGQHSDRELDKAVHGVLRLPVTPITEINLRVLVDGGEPVRGRPLVIDLTGPKSMASVKGITDDQGLARIRLRSGMSLWGLRDWENLSVQLESPMLTVDRQILTRKDEVDGIYTMRVQAGSLELRLPEDVQHEGEVGKLRLRTKGRGGEYAMDFEQGQGRIELLPLDLIIDAKLTYWESDRHYELSVEGPSQSGQTVVGQFQVSPGPVALSFRLLDPEGTPLTGQSLQIWQYGIGKSVQSNQAQVGRDGRVQFFLNVPKNTQPDLLVLSIHRGAKPFFKRLEFPEPLPPGINDLGDVTMDWEPMIVTGKVVDLDGQALAGVDVQANGYFSGNGSRRPRLIPKVRVGEDGRFQVRSWQELDGLRVRAYKESWLQREAVHALAGQQDLVLVMERAGSVEARLLTDFDPGSSLGIRLICEDESLAIRGRNAQLHPISPGVWRLRVNRLQSASYELQVLAQSYNLIRSYPGIRVGTGEELSLGDLDLRGFVKKSVIAVVDTAGRPVPDAFFMEVRDESGPHLRSRTDALGRATVLHWGEPVALHVWKEEVGFARVADPREDQELVLRQRSHRASLQGDFSFLQNQDRVRVVFLQPRDEKSNPWLETTLTFIKGSGEYDLALPEVDRLRVEWFLGFPGLQADFVGSSLLRVQSDLFSVPVPEDVLLKMKALAAQRR